jgi:hypothetical protein
MHYLGGCLIAIGVLLVLIELGWLAVSGAHGGGIILGLLILAIVAMPLILVGGYLVSRRP